MSRLQIQTQAEWLRVLGKGMLTIPKTWRMEFGIQEGEMVQAEKTKDGIFIRPLKKTAPYRIYSKKELLQFVSDDKL
ncbi:hypothetical protein AUK04_01620 [Candidatus Roizmanbacteria bacterium CG2_30_33_16]|uniref:SpoVT-AbrB domain-containing protein n=4 Tax=Candidatus Roizmaniibacteriota TaxID=1752723 RepID=A0A2H0C2I1_9BACT|nr:AbrB/MazE/SpoVT family DNA-binding domain-containing protein [Candidatus Roizmanbacteria bacterium]OIP85087.1 MAG: hypothetical protein AUK04_01620 [Candidatus Roizmanbacteria bacterium CG2_30_33_16]PIP64113.1 MAG: hypothetical protein COW96_04335 [Candidatus Roizmanbacteria bacterium CG22_combo_CG10-13_8_21_14_all_33_16]PIX71271.1 MAG: hypothetical protein COZ39_03750 [Candidatus Roizmanbacteria bacterium CG_4_10_14_3_um_filter_33_21]PJB88081.1 MAG: hypothetical protein CO083_03610 [Candida